MTDLTYALLQLGVMALVTYLIRMLPMTLFTRKIRSRFLRSFLYYVPLILAFCRKGLLTVAVSACAAVFLTNLLLTLF